MKNYSEKLKKFLNNNEGKMGFIILFGVVVLALFLTGGLFTKLKTPKIASQQQNQPTSAGGTCCDKGNGDACVPYDDDDHTFTYKGDKYGLLKSNVSFTETYFHLEDAHTPYKDKNGNVVGPIIINTSDESNPIHHGVDAPQCTGGDALRSQGSFTYGIYTFPNCLVVPDEQFVYVCRENCTSVVADPRCSVLRGVSCYGSPSSKYDVYFRIKDGKVPDEVRNCQVISTQSSSQPVPVQTVPQQVLIYPTDKERDNLHLGTFKVIEPTMPQLENTSAWLSPWCKPAIYLYPQEKTNVSVEVKPQGKMTYTTPLYPKDGWKVTAYPNGQLAYQNASYDYLYYETEIPNESYKKPQEGFVFEHTSLTNQLETLLTKLGLNQNERNEFISYWVKVLPKTQYYFVGIIPQTELDTIAPLTFDPKPETIIRVTLYFEALDENINIINPTIQTPTRSGFTVVEWGGIFQRDKNHPFSCFM